MESVIFNCNRCGIECGLEANRNENAQMLRKSENGNGVCIDCAVCEWLANSYPLNMRIDQSSNGIELFLKPELQNRFADVMRAADADANPAEIDWQRVVDNWHLPVAVSLDAINLYMPKNGVLRV